MKRLLGAVMALVLMAGCSTSEAAEDDASLAVAAEQPAAEASVEPTQPEPEPNQADVPTARPAPRRQAPAPQPVEPEPAPEPEPEPVPRLVIPAETTLFFVMDEGISTKNNTAGDQFTLSLSEDVTDAAGGVLLAAGTQAVGVISEAAESPGSDQPAVLRFTVESVAVVGAVAGAAAGTALWLATRDGHAELPSGAVLTFGLAEAVVIY
jgi:outer membrane biosynthesis protein TonB